MSKSPWTTRSDFIPISHLGGGSFGSVWRAKHALVNQDYAIKQVLINKTLAHFDWDVDKVYREVRNMEKLSTLNHASIVQYRHCWLEGENVKDNKLMIGKDLQTLYSSASSSSTQSQPPETNFLFIQMELCDSNLEIWLKQNPSIESRVEEIPKLLTQLSDGLQYIHGQNVIHRDLKPDNIFAKNNSQGIQCWKIGDFGMSTDFETGREIEPGSCEGQPHIIPDHEITMESDIFMMGLIFLKILDFTADICSLYPYLISYEQLESLCRNKFCPAFSKLTPIICKMLHPTKDQRPVASSLFLEITKFFHPSNNEKNLPLNEKPVKKINPIWSQMRKPASNYVGRVHFLSILRTEFEKGSPSITSILGLGGVGKSELVKKFGTDLYNLGLANCVWLDCSSLQSFTRSIQIFVHDCQVDLPSGDFDHGFSFQHGYKTLPPLQTILILDNVDGMFKELENFIHSFKQYEPSTLLPFILITTRIREIALSFGEEIVDLPVLNDEEAIDLIQSSKISCSTEESAELSKLLQNFALALQQAIAYIRERKKIKRLKTFRICDYIALFEQQKRKLLSHKLSLLDHDYSLTTLTTWKLNFESIIGDPDVGDLSREILNCWACLFLCKGEELGFVIELMETLISLEENVEPCPRTVLTMTEKLELVTCTKFHKPCWKARGSTERPYVFDEYSKEVDLEDDVRSSAQAIQLIRSYSLCNLEIRCNEIGRDCQFVTMHGLVQEIIRLETFSCDKLEKEWLIQTCDRFMHPTFRSWTMSGSSEKFVRSRDRFTEGLLSYVQKYDETFLRKFVQIVHNIWQDSCVGYLPNIDQTVLVQFVSKAENCHLKGVEIALIQKYVLQCDFLAHFEKNSALKWAAVKPVIPTTKSMDAIHQFDSNSLFLLLTQVSKEEAIYYEIFNLIINKIFTRQYFNLGCSALEFISNMERILLDAVDISLDLVQTTNESIPVEVMYIVLQIAGRILEFSQDPDRFSFFFNIASKVDLQHHPEFKHLFRMMALCFFKHQETGNLETYLYENAPFQHLAQPVTIKDYPYICQLSRKCLLSCTPPLASSLLFDLIPVPAEFIVQAHLSYLVAVLEEAGEIKDLKYFAIRFLQRALQLCFQNEFSAAQELIHRAHNVECHIFWPRKMYKESGELCKLLPPLCEFRHNFHSPELLPGWIDDFAGRATSVGWSVFEENERYGHDLDQGLKMLTSTTNSEIDVTDVAVPDFSFTGAIIALPNITQLQHYWDTCSYEQWLNGVQTMVSNSKKSPLKGYTESKLVAQIAINLSHLRSVENIPLSVLSWAVLFVFEHKSDWETDAGQLDIVPISRIIIERLSCKGINELHEFSDGLVKIGQVILGRRKTNAIKDILNTIQLPNLWHVLYGITVVSKFISDHKMSQFCLLFDIPNDNALSIVVSKVGNLIEHSGVFCYPVIISTILGFLQLSEFRSSDLNFDLASVSRQLIRLFISECFRFLNFKPIIKLCQGIEKFCMGKDTGPCNALAKQYSILNVGQEFSFSNYGMLPDCLRLYKTAKDQIKTAEFDDSLHKQLKMTMDEIVKQLLGNPLKPGVREFTNCEIQYFYCFLLQHGNQDMQLKELLVNILTSYCDDGDYVEIYNFGLKLSYIPKKKICLHTQLEESLIEITYCLRLACEDFGDRMKRLFKSSGIKTKSEENNRGMFLTLVVEMFAEFGVVLEGEILSDGDNSDYLPDEQSTDEDICKMMVPLTSEMNLD